MAQDVLDTVTHSGYGSGTEQAPAWSPRSLGIGIRAKLLLAVGAVAAMTLLAGTVSWSTYVTLERMMYGITAQTFPSVTAALKLSEASSRLTATATTLENARTPFQRHSSYTGLRQQIDQVSGRIAELARLLPERAELADLRRLVEELLASLEQQNWLVARRIGLETQRRGVQDALMNALDTFRNGLGPMIARTEDAADDPAGIRRLADLATSGISLAGYATEAANTLSGEHLEVLGTRFAADVQLLSDRIDRLPVSADQDRMAVIARTLVSLGTEHDNLFELRTEELAVRTDIIAANARNRGLAARIASSVALLAVEAEAEAERTNVAAGEQVNLSRTLALVIALATFIGPGLFVWVYFGRSIVGRLVTLAEDTRRIAGGDLSAPIRRSGQDEIAGMADALLAFRDSMIKLQEATEARRAIEQRLDLALSATRTAAWDVDISTNRRWWSPHYYQMLGYGPGEMEPSDEVWRSLIHPDDLPMVIAATGAAEDDTDPPEQFRVSYRMRCKNGDWLWVEDTGRVIRASDGTPQRRTGTKTDMTERRRAEEALRQAKEEAENAYSQLRAAQESLVQTEKMASLGQLVAGVAHEINTPIGIVLTGASYLASETDGLQAMVETGQIRKSSIKRYIQKAIETSQLILLNSQRAADLVQGFKQVAVDQTSDERRIFDLHLYIEEVLISLGPRVRQPGHKVTVTCPDGIRLDGYPGALSQVLTNLVMNTLIHAFDEGQVGHIAITATRHASDIVEIRFTDNGKGIPAEYRSKIFDPFFTTKRGSGGSGLGLHIVYNMVTSKLKGQISVQSEEGAGTTFLIRIPRVIPAAA